MLSEADTHNICSGKIIKHNVYIRIIIIQKVIDILIFFIELNTFDCVIETLNLYYCHL